MTRARWMLGGLLAAGLLAQLPVSSADANGDAGGPMATFDHIVVIVEQDHTYDSYFRDYEPGAASGTGGGAPGLRALAEQYALFDQYFASSAGGTLGNMLDLTTGTTHGLVNSSKASLAALADMTAPTVFDSMNDAGVDWRLYVGDLAQIDPRKVADGSYQQPDAPVPASLYRAPMLAMRRTWTTPALADNIVDQDAFFADTDEGSLPAVSFVYPSPTDHPGQPGNAGETRLLSLVNAIQKSDQWRRTAVFVVWDDGGGQFDSAIPPVGNGLRVPLLLISPYARQGYLSSVQLDHTSLLGFIERRFDLTPLGGDPTDQSLSIGDAIDATQPPRGALVFSRSSLPATPVGTGEQNMLTVLLYLAGFATAACIATLGWTRLRKEAFHADQPT